MASLIRSFSPRYLLKRNLAATSVNCVNRTASMLMPDSLLLNIPPVDEAAHLLNHTAAGEPLTNERVPDARDVRDSFVGHRNHH